MKNLYKTSHKVGKYLTQKYDIHSDPVIWNYSDWKSSGAKKEKKRKRRKKTPRSILFSSSSSILLIFKALTGQAGEQEQIKYIVQKKR